MARQMVFNVHFSSNDGKEYEVEIQGGSPGNSRTLDTWKKLGGGRAGGLSTLLQNAKHVYWDGDDQGLVIKQEGLADKFEAGP